MENEKTVTEKTQNCAACHMSMYSERHNLFHYIMGAEGGKSKTLRGDKVRFEYAGNIFKHYDSYALFPAFLKGNEDESFNLRHAVPTGYTRAEVADFNDQHDYTVPDTYYKKRK